MGGILGASLKAVGSIFGGHKASQAMQQYRSNVESAMAKDDDWYNHRYYEDNTQRADARAILTETLNSIRERNKAAAGTQAVMGGTDESVAAAKAANNAAMVAATSKIAADGASRQDNIEQQHRTMQQHWVDELNNAEKERAKNIMTAVTGVNKTVDDIEKGFNDL